jgi:hypothetical protein
MTKPRAMRMMMTRFVLCQLMRLQTCCPVRHTERTKERSCFGKWENASAQKRAFIRINSTRHDWVQLGAPTRVATCA